MIGLTTTSHGILKDWWIFAPTHFVEALKSLSFREREIIKLRLGIGDEQSFTLEQTARVFKVTRERVRQIENKGYRKMRSSLRKLLNKNETRLIHPE